MFICIDAGHGGTDPGAIAGGVEEADVALAYAEELARQFMGRGATIALTRRADVECTLAQRCRIANELSVDAFVSLHANASGSSTAHGVQVFHCDGSAQGLALARAVYDRITEIEPQPGAWSGVYPDDGPACGNRRLYVLRGTRMPAILIELGFLTSPEDRARLVDVDRRLSICSAIAEGVLQWSGRQAVRP